MVSQDQALLSWQSLSIVSVSLMFASLLGLMAHCGVVG